MSDAPDPTADPARTALVLSQWFSAGYPTGAFAWSHGLENAVAEDLVTDAATFRDWAADCLTHGAGRADCILLAHAWRDPGDEEPAELAAALAPSAERRAETLALGAAFAAATAASWGPEDLAPAAYPVAVGRAARANGLPLPPVLAAYAQGFLATLASAAQRLVPLGHTEAQAALAALAPLALATAEEAERAGLHQIGGAAFHADIAAMRHEVQEPRLFRS